MTDDFKSSEAENNKNSETHDNPPIVKVEIKTEPEDQVLGYELNVIIKEENRHFVDVNTIKAEVDPLYIDGKELDSKRLKSKDQETPFQIVNLLLRNRNREKSAVKNEKAVKRKKAPRSDKGKSRVTSYMLWAKDVRQDLVKKHPDMDFSTISKKLAELWASVSRTEKYNLKRRAKRLAAKAK